MFLLVSFIIFIVYYLFTDLWNSAILVFSLIMTISFTGYWGPYSIAYLFPKIEHSRMLRVRIRKYLLFTIIPLIVIGLVVNSLYDVIRQ